MVRVGIVGGGIGGLAAAVALRARGFDVRVFERAERCAGGVALLVWANAVRTLGRLGIDLAPLSAPIVHTEIRTSAGVLLCSLPIDDWSARAGARSLAIRRPLLVKTLFDALPLDVVESGQSVISFKQAHNEVVLTLANGSRREFDAVIGADGVSSVVRAQLHGGDPIRFGSQRLWIGLARPRVGLLTHGVTIATIGRGPRFWIAPLPDGEAFWFATFNRSEAPTDASPLEYLRHALDGWPAPIGEVLDATREEDVMEARSSDRPPSDRWGDGRVTLLGDAAHASTPDLGQGACQAIESASVLADSLATSKDVVAGLRNYERARMDRTATISRMSWITSQNTTIESPVLCTLRDVGIRLGFPSIARRNFAWMMGHAGS